MSERARPVLDCQKGAHYQNLGANGQGRKKVPLAVHETVIVQRAQWRTPGSVAATVTRGEIALHNCFLSTRRGTVLALNGASGRFEHINADRPMPVALAAKSRLAAGAPLLEAAE